MSGYVGDHPPQSFWTRVRYAIEFEIQAFPLTVRCLRAAARYAVTGKRGDEA